MIEGFLKYWPIGHVSSIDPVLDEEVWSFALGSQIPPDIPVMIGEVLHNIRSSLDQLMCAIASNYSGTSKDTYFPFSKEADSLDSQIKQKCRRLPGAANDLIRKWRPYKGGNDLLWFLHDLNRSDKHVDIIPVNLSTGVNSATYLTVWSGLILVIGHRNAQHLLVRRASLEEIAQMGSPTAVYSVPPGTQLSFNTHGCSAEESMEFLRSTPGAKFSTDMRPMLDVAFRDNCHEPLEPVCSVLTRMADEARKVVVDFEKAFF